MAACVVAQYPEGGIDIGGGLLGEHAGGALNRDTAVERRLQLLGQVPAAARTRCWTLAMVATAASASAISSASSANEDPGGPNRFSAPMGGSSSGGSSATLPFTGADLELPLILGSLLVGLGGLLMLAGLRRRRS